ncbi:MAG: helix-turn-helix transcriptional regulator [Eubacteriales bacterium]
MTLGAKISMNRNKLALSQSDLAEKLEIPLKELTNWESNITDPNKEMTEKLAELFSIDSKELQSDDDGTPIFKDHPEEVKAFNGKLSMRYSCLFAILGIFFTCCFWFLGVYVLTPAVVSLAVAGYFFHKGSPMMALYKKLFIFTIALVLLVVVFQGSGILLALLLT